MRITATGAVTGTPIEPLAEAELAFLDRATAVDGSPAISGGLLAIATGDDDARDAQTASSVWRVHLEASPDLPEAGRLVGFGIRALQGERHAAEFVVDPDHRRLGIGEALLSAILGEEPESWCWSHGDHPGARRLADIHGLGRDRVLYQMRTDADLELADLPETNAPEGVTIRSFAPGDEAGWLRVNNAAFDWHPEQGSQTPADIERIVTAEDFDPDSVIIAARDDQTTATGERVIGFHQTKLSHEEGNGRLGEVYVVGVDPSIHAKGVGKALTVEGMRRMVAAGARAIELYVESDNEAALGLYQRLGFHVAVAHVSYAPASSTAGNQEQNDV